MSDINNDIALIIVNLNLLPVKVNSSIAAVMVRNDVESEEKMEQRIRQFKASLLYYGMKHPEYAVPQRVLCKGVSSEEYNERMRKMFKEYEFPDNITDAVIKDMEEVVKV